MMKNLDLENLDLEPHDREVKISISSRKLKKVSRRSVYAGAGDDADDEGEVGGNKYVAGDDDLVAKKYICSV